MIFPKTTESNTRIPKTKFYSNLDLSPAVKEAFVDQIKTIYWRNKIASTTTNLAPGIAVTEIEIFGIHLKTTPLDERVLRQIDKEIPYHIVFLLEYEDKYQAWTAYKQASTSGNTAFKVNQYYHTDWMSQDELPLKLEGLDLDAAYENFVYQIAGDRLSAEADVSLEEAVQRDERRKKIEIEIARLEKQARAEKQPKKKFELVQQINRLRDTLSGKE